MSLPVRGFHHTSSSPWAEKGLAGPVLPRAGIWERFPAPAAPPGRKRRAGAGEEERAWREQHEKANPLPIVQCSKRHHGLLFCSPSPERGSIKKTPKIGAGEVVHSSPSPVMCTAALLGR